MHTNPRSSRHVTVSRKALIGILAAALVIIAALVAAFILITASGQNPWPNRAVIIPGAALPDLQTPQALRYDLSTAEKAQPYFERLLDSPYVHLRGDVPVPAQSDGDGWTVREENADGTALSAVFDTQGVVSALSVTTNLQGKMKNANPPYSLGSGDESLFSYLRAFAYEYLPDVTIDSGEIAADQYNDEGRFLTILADNRLARGAYEFVVQVDPEIRIVGFRLLVDKELAFIRTSRMAETAGADPGAQPAAADPGTVAEPLTEDTAVQLARGALADAFDLDAGVVDGYVLVEATRYVDSPLNWYGTVYDGTYWVVSFRLPDTPDSIYSDYDVFIEDATGEVLRIMDPSNNSNG